MRKNLVHLPDTYDENQVAGTACGLVLGHDVPAGDVVLTDPEEEADVTCDDCLATR